MIWCVTFADGTRIWVEAATADDACFKAKLMAWEASGKWWQCTADPAAGAEVKHAAA